MLLADILIILLYRIGSRLSYARARYLGFRAEAADLSESSQRIFRKRDFLYDCD